MKRITHMIAWTGILTMIAFFSLEAKERQTNGTSNAHNTTAGFRNTHPIENPSFLDFLKWRWDRLWMDIPAADSYSFPMAKNDPGALQTNKSRPSFTWIGHATALVQINGKNILTDPQFSKRASPVQWAGPKRVVEPGLSLEELPKIDAVLISHDHYDSLDYNSTMELIKRPGGDSTKFFVGLGLGSILKKWGVENVIEMNWWETRKIDGLEFIAVPCRHWSKRALTRRNQTLWAGWIARSKDFSFYFAGDSGYSPVFKDIGEKYGPFDLAAIPIGAYEPRWFMKSNHMNPEEAVQVHKDTKAKKSIAIHWGTFALTDEPLDEPPKRLGIALERAQIPKEDFFVVKHGETIYLK